MKKVSIIIPIYNTDRYLFRCLESVCSQTYQNMEIICIDDGSTDNSGNILEEYARNDSRIKAVHQKNHGESNARNEGLKLAKGDYIGFIDCDDWIDSDMYEILMTYAENNDLDIVASSWYKETASYSKKAENQFPITEQIFGSDMLLKYIYMRDSYRGFAYMWNKLYKRRILENDKGALLLFDESLRLGGDVVYLAQTALRTGKAKYIDRAFYHYRQREDSGCHTKDIGKMRDWIKAYEIVIELFEKEKVDKETVNYVKRFLAYHSSNAAVMAIEQNRQEEKIIFQTFMKKYKKEYLELNRQHGDRIQRYELILKQ